MSDYNNNQGFELGWDSEIEKDSPDFILLPDGEYDFVVKSFERGRYNGGDKIGPCPKAILKLGIDTYEGEAVVRKELLLHSRLEGLLCEFFVSIGQRQHGQRVAMNWNAVTGARGRCKIGTYIGKDGNKYNEVKKFLEPKQGAQPQQYQQPQQYAGAPQNMPTAPVQPPMQPTTGGGWQGGKF